MAIYQQKQRHKAQTKTSALRKSMNLSVQIAYAQQESAPQGAMRLISPCLKAGVLRRI